MGRHTPGPWNVTGQSEAARYITVKGANGRTVARVPWSSEADAEAGVATDASDARLIAAAPDLLGSARDVLTAWDAFDENGPEPIDALVAALRAAVAKAEGTAHGA